MARVHRLGQKAPVQIVRLVAADEASVWLFTTAVPKGFGGG